MTNELDSGNEHWCGIFEFRAELKFLSIAKWVLLGEQIEIEILLYEAKPGRWQFCAKQGKYWLS
jgi:hypothetical protein